MTTIQVLAKQASAPDQAPSHDETPEIQVNKANLKSKFLVWKKFFSSPSLVVSSFFLLIVLGFAFFPTLFTTGDPFQTDASLKLQPPSTEHFFGTDALGRDVFTRFVYGTNTTLTAALIALSLAFVVSAVLGLLAGYLGGVVDDIVSRIIDIFLAVPGLLISLMLVTGLGFGIVNIAIAVGISSIAAFTRVMRAQVLRIRQSDFVTYAKFAGVPWYVIIIRHIFPHSAGPVVALTALELGAAILSISALSFLGFGATAPAPEWGSLVAYGRDYLAYAWWLTILPGAMIVFTVLAANRLAEYFERRTH